MKSIYKIKCKKKVPKIFFIVATLTWITFLILWLAFFDSIRGLFPVPVVDNTKIMGYAQYYKYPLYFDHIMYFALLLSPFFAVFLAKIIIIKKQ